MDNSEFDSDSPRRPVAKPIVLGAFIPIAVHAVLTLTVGWIANQGTEPIPGILTIGTFAISIGLGFLVMTRRCTTAEKLAITLGYVPVMLGVLLMETYFLGVRFLGSDTL